MSVILLQKVNLYFRVYYVTARQVQYLETFAWVFSIRDVLFLVLSIMIFRDRSNSRYEINPVIEGPMVLKMDASTHARHSHPMESLSLVKRMVAIFESWNLLKVLCFTIPSVVCCELSCVTETNDLFMIHALSSSRRNCLNSNGLLLLLVGDTVPSFEEDHVQTFETES